MGGTKSLSIADKMIGPGSPTFVIAEIGLNHNGSLDLALELMRVAKDAGCDAVKFQKRTPELCVPPEMREVMRETPWGIMTYLDYRYRVEFAEEQYTAIAAEAEKLGMLWSASPWDLESLAFVERFNVPFHKVPSAMLTNDELLGAIASTGKPVILSTGMSSLEEIDHAVGLLDKSRLLLMHCTSTYPCPPEELNLRGMVALRDRYGVPVGYSGHEVGLQTTVVAVAIGADAIERHITLDRAMWGSDQAASVEPGGLRRLIRDIRLTESSLGDGLKRVYESELPIRKKLRGV